VFLCQALLCLACAKRKLAQATPFLALFLQKREESEMEGSLPKANEALARASATAAGTKAGKRKIF